MSFTGAGVILNTKVDKAKKLEKRLQYFKDRKDQGLSSQLIFTAEDLPGFTHAVLVYDYKVEGDKTILCLQDNNEKPEANENCGNKMIFTKKDGNYNIVYPTWSFFWDGKIGGFNLNVDEDYDTIKQIKSLHKYCVQNLCNKKEQTLLQEMDDEVYESLDVLDN